jgi:hypothetical protein
LRALLLAFGTVKKQDQSSVTELNAETFILFGAYFGQRSLSTICKLKVGQFEKPEADKPYVEIHSDKIKTLRSFAFSCNTSDSPVLARKR